MLYIVLTKLGGRCNNLSFTQFTCTDFTNKLLFLIYRTAPSSAKTSIPVSPLSGNSRFPRGTQSRSTFHGGPIRDRRTPNAYNGPGAVPTQTQDTSAMGPHRMSFFNKLTSKFSRRLVYLNCFSAMLSLKQLIASVNYLKLIQNSMVNMRYLNCYQKMHLQLYLIRNMKYHVEKVFF